MQHLIFKSLYYPFYLLTILIWVACSPGYMVVDRTGMTFFVDKVKLEMDLEVIDGEATRHLPIKQISRIVIDPTQTYFRNDKLYYFSLVELIDGTQIKPRENGREITKSFVCIENNVWGKGTNGIIEMPLENINIIQLNKK